MEFLQQQQPQLCNINIKPRKSILEVHNHKLGGGMIGAEGSEKYPPNKIVQIQSVFRGVLERKRVHICYIFLYLDWNSNTPLIYL